MSLGSLSSNNLYFENFIRLYEAVKEVESGGNKYAVRFEPHYMSRIKSSDLAYVRAKKHVYAFPSSLRAYLSFSVGRLQIMVYNMYAWDDFYIYLKMNDLLPVCIPNAIDEKHEMALFHIFLREKLPGFYAKLKANAVGLEDFQVFGRVWNGGTDYGSKVYKRYQGD